MSGFFCNPEVGKTFPTIIQNAETKREKNDSLIILYKKKLVYGSVCAYTILRLIIQRFTSNVQRELLKFYNKQFHRTMGSKYEKAIYRK